MVGKRERVVTRRRSHHAARALFGAEGEEELRAPRSLNEPVACCHSCLRKIFMPVMAERARDLTRGVRTTPLRMRKCAVETSSKAGRSWPLTTLRGVTMQSLGSAGSHPRSGDAAEASAVGSGSEMLQRGATIRLRSLLRPRVRRAAWVRGGANAGAPLSALAKPYIVGACVSVKRETVRTVLPREGSGWTLVRSHRNSRAEKHVSLLSQSSRGDFRTRTRPRKKTRARARRKISRLESSRRRTWSGRKLVGKRARGCVASE